MSLRRPWIFVLTLLVATAQVAVAQSDCGKPPSGAGTHFHIAPGSVSSGDTVLVARLCLTAGAKGLGSYMASIAYDSVRMRVARVETPGGMQVANSRTPGVIRVAGASPGGFANGPLVIITFSRRGASSLAPISLSVSEASTPAGGSLAGEVRATGWPAPGKP